MSTEYRNLGRTRLHVSYPWGLMLRKGSRLLCSDGVVRAPAYLASTADTFFSTPCAMVVKGKYLTGYMTGEETGESFRAFVFRQHVGQGNHLPEWPSWPKYDSRELSGEQWEEQCAKADARLSELVLSVHAVEGGAT